MASNSGTESGFYFFGRDIMTIPCFRKCFLTGFSAAIGSTLLTFLLTSNPSKAAKIGQFVFMGVSFPYWFYCREEEYQRDFALREAQQLISERAQDEYIITDSLEFDPETFG